MRVAAVIAMTVPVAMMAAEMSASVHVAAVVAVVGVALRLVLHAIHLESGFRV